MTTTRPGSVAVTGPVQPGAGAAGPGTTVAEEVESLSQPARRLLAAADELFYHQGAAATTVRAITGACGLSPGALYNHFTSKDDLLYWLVMQRHRVLDLAVEEALAVAPPDPVRRLQSVVAVYVHVHMQPEARRGARVANREYRQLSGDRLAEVLAIRRRLRDRVCDILVDGARQGRFAPCGGTDAASIMVAAVTIIDMCVHAAEWLREGGTLSIEQLQDRYVAMAMRLVGAPGA